MIDNGFYIIKEEFFYEYYDPFLKYNKNESRPHYYCFRDNDLEIFWMIPLSSKVNKYRKLITKIESKNKTCDILYIAKLDNDKESVFLIQDMFPITIDYIDREYTINNKHLILTSEKTKKEIDKRAKKVVNLLKHGVKFTSTSPDILDILKRLKVASK